MDNFGYPRLCGGIFFLLLLQALKPRTKARTHYAGEGDGLNEKDVLIALIRVAQPDYLEPAASTFSNNTSKYKSCELSGNTYLPFRQQAFRSSFDAKVKDEYKESLALMSAFADRFIDTGTIGKHVHLVKALMELIGLDQSIKETDVFYVSADAAPLSKTELRSLSEVQLPAFLLGIWHFIVVQRHDNSIGQATYVKWTNEPVMKGSPRAFCSCIGEGLTQELNFLVSTDDYADREDRAESGETDFYSEKEPDATMTINNNGILLQQFGTNNKQVVGKIETLIINND